MNMITTIAPITIKIVRSKVFPPREGRATILRPRGPQVDELFLGEGRRSQNWRTAPRLRLADLLAGLSMVADMGYSFPVGHAMRTCLIGVGLARRLGLDDREIADTLYTSMLVHIGCLGFSHEMSAVFGDELRANRAGARTDFSDPRDVFATLIPESTRGLGPTGRVRTAALILTRGREPAGVTTRPSARWDGRPRVVWIFPKEFNAPFMRSRSFGTAAVLRGG